MKKLLILTMACVLSLSASAQRKHSILVGAQYVQHAKPGDWPQKERLPNPDPSAKWYHRVGLWVGYEYKNSFSLRIQNSYLNQGVQYNGLFDGTTSYTGLREAYFFDLLFGYNVAKHLPLPKAFSGWVYAGAGFTGPNAFVVDNYYQNDPSYPSCGEGLYDGTDYSYRLHPTTQVMLKYNPIRHVFVGIGGSYRYVGKDFQALAGNVTLGFQL